MSSYITVAPIAESTPGFSFGRSGACGAGTYLQIDGVPSNLSGRIVPFELANITTIFISCQLESTFDIDIQTRTGSTFTTIYTANVVASRIFTERIEDVEVLLGDEISVNISSGSTSNIIVGLIIKGNGT